MNEVVKEILRGGVVGLLLVGLVVPTYFVFYVCVVKPLLMMHYQTVLYLSFVVYEVFVVEPSQTEAGILVIEWE